MSKSRYETIVKEMAYIKARLAYFETERNFGVGNVKDDVIKQLEGRFVELLTILANETNKESV